PRPPPAPAHQVPSGASAILPSSLMRSALRSVLLLLDPARAATLAEGTLQSPPLFVEAVDRPGQLDGLRAELPPRLPSPQRVLHVPQPPVDLLQPGSQLLDAVRPHTSFLGLLNRRQFHQDVGALGLVGDPLALDPEDAQAVEQLARIHLHPERPRSTSG